MRMLFPHAPGRLIGDLTTDMNALVESIFGEDDRTSHQDFSPAMDIEDTDDGYKLTLDLPGVKPEEVHVELDEDRVTIHGTRHDHFEQAEDKRRRIERRFGEFRRSVKLPVAVNKDAIVANYEDGVLTVTLPKAADRGAHRIEISRGRVKGES